jgi:hypothetical protein
MKGRRVLVTFIAACATVCMMTPSVAQAANTTCANADFLYPNERAQYFVGGSTSIFFKFRVNAGRSYAVMSWAPFTDAGEGGVSLDTALYTDSACTTGAGGQSTTDREPLMSVNDHSGDVDSIIAPADGTIFVDLHNFIASGQTVHILVVETTLFSPWWFTGGTNQAYVELRNNMSSSTTGTLTFYAANGSVCGTSAVSVNGNGNAAVQINAVGTCASSVSGSAQLAFQGTSGGMTANITTLDVPNGTSFDSPFTPRMVWGTLSR